MSGQIEAIREMFSACYETARTQSQKPRLDDFYDAVVKRFEKPKTPNEPVAIAIWLYTPRKQSMFAQTASDAIGGVVKIEPERGLSFELAEGFVFVEIADNSFDALRRIENLVTVAASAGAEYSNSYWSLNLYQPKAP